MRTGSLGSGKPGGDGDALEAQSSAGRRAWARAGTGKKGARRRVDETEAVDAASELQESGPRSREGQRRRVSTSSRSPSPCCSRLLRAVPSRRGRLRLETASAARAPARSGLVEYEKFRNGRCLWPHARAASAASELVEIPACPQPILPSSSRSPPHTARASTPRAAHHVAQQAGRR